MKYFRIGEDTYAADFYTVIDEAGKVEFDLYRNGDYFKTHYLKVYYRSPKTLDDHMGNTDCGYYVNVPFVWCSPYGTLHKSRTRVYLH